MRWSLVALAAPALAGCSLIYNPNNLPDPRTIDAALQDTNPCALELTGISPATLDEGQGDHGSAPALLVLHGNNLVNQNLKVEITAPGGATVHLDPVTDAQASRDTTSLAFTVTSRVDPALTVDTVLDVTVSQSSATGCSPQATLPGQLKLHGLPELTAAAGLTALAPRYSTVSLGTVTLAPAGHPTGYTIKAVSSIAMGQVTLSGNGITAGPGGVDGGGGAGGGTGGGGVGGSVSGLGLGNGGGGGGGGYSADGKPGGTGSGLNGGTAGAAGLQSGDDELLGMNRACAGGAGGAGGLTAISPGGAGGGGGGTLTLIAGGDITVTKIVAHGGNGTTPSGGGGGGGGGAGGTVYLRTANGALSVTSIEVPGGPGGGTNGGAGSPGRVRWDAPGDTPPSSPSSVPVRGPSFVASTRIFTSSSATVDLKGPGSRGFLVRVIDQDGQSHDGGLESFNGQGLASIRPKLYPGHNQVCVILDGGPQTTVPDQCLDVAFLP